MSCRQIFDKVQRPAEDFAAGFGLLAFKVGVAQSQPGIARIGAQALELIGLEGEFAVRALVSAAEGELLFNQARAQCNRGHGRGGGHGVIRLARQHIETLGEFGYLAEVGLIHRCGVAAYAVQQHQIVAARLARRGHGFVDFILRGQAGGHDHGLAGAGHITNQRQALSGGSAK